MFPNISGDISQETLDVSDMNIPRFDNITITDSINDVCSIDYLTGETIIVTSHPNITVANLDILRATFLKQDTQATVSLQVVGNIENRREIIYNGDILESIDAVEYVFQLITSEQDYKISYSNETGQIMYGSEQINLTSSDFSVDGGILTVWFSLVSADEIYEELIVVSTFIKVNFTNFEEEGFVYLSDIAPNPPLEIIEVYAPSVGYVGQTIQFNASVEPFTGLPPYTYHWDFGDQGTSTQLNPTHVYTKPGVYTYTFTVTDDAGATASDFGYITIHREGRFIKAFLFGRYANNITDNDSRTFAAVNLRMILFRPLKFHHFTSGETIIVSNQFLGLWGKQSLFGLFSIISVSKPPKTPHIACVIDSVLNRVIVASVDVFVKWRDIAIKATNNATWQVFSAQGMALDLPNHTDGIVTDVIPGDYIQLSGTTGKVVVTLRYIHTNTLLGAWTVNV